MSQKLISKMLSGKVVYSDKAGTQFFGKAVPKAVLSHEKKLFGLALELRAKPVPPVQDSFLADIYSTLIKQVFYIPQ